MPCHHPILYCSAATIVALPLLLSDPFNGIRIVAAAGKDRLREYIEEIFDPALIELGYYTEENAEQWLDINKFMRWLSLQAQKSPARPVAPRPTVNSHPVPHLHNSQLPPSSPIPGTSSPLVTTTKSTRESQSSSPIHGRADVTTDHIFQLDTALEPLGLPQGLYDNLDFTEYLP
ncbi:hypothetical protein B0H11DRAFT_1907862 [Mycena galericulata]|nr:hypothetical protein B0H11DRAFT_1907862 [Mycena galericulata]